MWSCFDFLLNRCHFNQIKEMQVINIFQISFSSICRYADIYTSRVSNFLHYTPFMYFRSQEQVSRLSMIFIINLYYIFFHNYCTVHRLTMMCYGLYCDWFILAFLQYNYVILIKHIMCFIL